jgi:hypothetical protein
MHAHKLNVTVQPDHRLAIDLPADFPQGPAEVIVLAQVRAASPVSPGGAGSERTEEAFARLFPRDPALGPVVFHEDPTAPLHAEDWPDASGDEAAP